MAATTTPAALAAKTATTTIPIVFATAADPIRAGLVTSLNRPGGNATGTTIISVEVAPKRLELLHELVPAASVIALLLNPATPALAETQSRSVFSAAHTLGLEVRKAELPVQQSTKVEMFLNLKTANALGITVPLPLIGRSDEVIE